MNKCLNKENDIALRKGTSAVYRANKNKEFLRNSMKNQDTKSALMDFIFGDSNVSPIIRNNDGNISMISSNINKLSLETHNSEAYYYLDCSINIETCSKICKCCGKEKDVAEFYVMKRSKDGLQHHCISCQKERLKIIKKDIHG